MILCPRYLYISRLSQVDWHVITDLFPPRPSNYTHEKVSIIQQGRVIVRHCFSKVSAARESCRDGRPLLEASMLARYQPRQGGGNDVHRSWSSCPDESCGTGTGLEKQCLPQPRCRRSHGSHQIWLAVKSCFSQTDGGFNQASSGPIFTRTRAPVLRLIYVLFEGAVNNLGTQRVVYLNQSSPCPILRGLWLDNGTPYPDLPSLESHGVRMLPIYRVYMSRICMRLQVIGVVVVESCLLPCSI